MNWNIGLIVLIGFTCCSLSVFPQQDRLKEVISKKNIEIENLKKEAILKEREAGEENVIRNVSFVLVVALVSAFLLLYHKHQLTQYKKYQTTINEQQNELFTAIISIQDNERKRFAEDLHDGLGSVLSAIKLNLTRMQDEKLALTEVQATRYDGSVAMLDEAIVELRNIAHNIMPASLSKLGLVVTLKNLFDAISSHSGIVFNFSAHEITGRFNETSEINIYRIILELANNIVKHSKAKEVSVQMIQYPDYINISVEDNGKGFDYHKIKNSKKGIGLTNISSRVEFMKGKLDIDSADGRGTTVFIEIPMREIRL